MNPNTMQSGSRKMNTPFNALVLHSESWYSRFIASLVSAYFPWVNLDVRRGMECEGSHDLYFVESHAHGEPIAQRLVPKLRRHRPDAMIVVVGCGNDERYVRGLIEGGCDFVWDRAVLSDTQRALDAVRAFIERRNRADRCRRNSSRCRCSGRR